MSLLRKLSPANALIFTTPTATAAATTDTKGAPQTLPMADVSHSVSYGVLHAHFVVLQRQHGKVADLRSRVSNSVAAIYFNPACN
jgi:hypothetical protein